MDYVCGQKTENVLFLKTLIYKNNTYFVAFSVSSHSPFLTKYPKTEEQAACVCFCLCDLKVAVVILWWERLLTAEGCSN